MNSRTASRLFHDSGAMLARFREAGDITLDLFHRDGRVDDKWLAFQPREFDLLWRLAQEPGRRVSKRQLLGEVWRIESAPDSNRVSRLIARLRNKLEPFGLARLIATHPDGGYYLDAPNSDILFTSEFDA